MSTPHSATALDGPDLGAPWMLVVDGVSPRRHRMTATLDQLGYRTFGVWTPLGAIDLLDRGDDRVVFAAIAEDARDGHLLRAFLTEHHPEVHVVVIADRIRAGTIVEAALGGAASAWQGAPPRPPEA
ncbi:MAG: hypothetical protein IPL61_38290 [Myxococcales bacterium]|nr:hypothetical protein [Myxococcales bacterium]